MLRFPVWVVVAVSLLTAGFPRGRAVGKETAVPARLSPFVEVTVEQGLVSADIHDALLADALRAVGERAGVQITFYSRSPERVTQALDGVAPEEAIQRLAQGYQVVLIYRLLPGEGRTGRLAEARVYQPLPPGAVPATPIVVGPPAPVVVEPPGRDARLQDVRALIQMAHQQEPGALDSLVATLMGEPDPVVRQIITASLAGNSRPEVVAALMAALGDTDPSVRAAAVSSIGQMRNERMTRTMGETLAKDPEPAVRRAAAWALSTQNSEAARRGLEAATADPDAWVRQAAVSALNQWEERVRGRSH